MQYRKLGYTGLDISVIGFGTWQLGGQRWAKLSDDESVRLLQHSLSQGINTYDVAVVYGQYKDDFGYLQSRSQELLGKAFKEQRQKVIYVVKVGQFDEYSHRHDYDPARIVEQVQQSLRRLQTNYLDVCLIHAPSIDSVIDGRAITVLKTLQALGIVKHIGYSFEEEPEHAQYAIEQKIDVIMLQYNILDNKCKNVIEQAREKGIGILVGGPLKRGYLTGKYTSVNDLPLEDEYWKLNTELAPYKVEQTLARVTKLLSKYGSQFELRKNAIDFVLQESGVCSCVIGHRDITEVDENTSYFNDYSSVSDNTIKVNF
jgi:myo-inositol catabolism protein IolS